MDLWLQILTNSPWQFANTARARAFELTPENRENYSLIFRTIYPACSQFNQQTLKLSPQQFAIKLWTMWLPLAMLIASYRRLQSKPLIQGILAVQGTGKTTLAAILSLILNAMGYRTICLSLDDLYKTYSDRLILRQQDPQLIWRGPPGTHDLALGLQVLDALHQPNANATIQLPRFDKSAYNGAGDRGTPEVIAPADIILFEGWFVGVRPINPGVFDTAPPPIITNADRKFARDRNAALQTYLPLWAHLDRLILLYPLDYRWSLQWRQQAEHQAKSFGKSGMSDVEIKQFVHYFWQSLHPDLFIKPLAAPISWVDLVIEIMRNRSWGKVYAPTKICKT